MKHFKLTTALILAVSLFMGTPSKANIFDHKKEKTLERSFKVDNSNQLKISNSYGKVRLINWDRPEIKVTIVITAEESSAQRAETALERVRIVESNQNKSIEFETKIEPAPSNWWSRGSSKSSLSIDYEVYLPKSNDITIQNRYGTTEIADRSGATNLSIGYGTLSTGKLLGTSNTISISYSQAKIAALSSANTTVKYSKFELGGADRLKLGLSYSSGTNIGLINKELEASVSYSGGFEVTLGDQFNKGAIKASYSGVQIRTQSKTQFKFDIAARYGNFDYDAGKARISSQNSGNTSKSYSGNWNGGSSGSLSVQSAYGNVSIK